MKIPKQAKKVFQGDIFSVYQWPQKMYNGDTWTFEMIKRKNTVQVIAVQDDKIFIARQKQPQYKKYFYSLPGGRIDDGEKPLSAAKRELLEEMGLKSNKWFLFDQHQPLHKMDWTVYTFIAQNCKTVAPQNLDAGEKIEIKKISFKQLLKMAFHKDVRGQDIFNEIIKLKLLGKEKWLKKKIFG